MDYTMLSLDAVPRARAGDEVVVIGTQGDGTVSIKNMTTGESTVVKQDKVVSFIKKI